jgi:hypothetical protein
MTAAQRCETSTDGVRWPSRGGDAALKEVDPEQTTVRVKLTTERAKRRGDKVAVTDPVTWKIDQPMTIKHVVYGGTVRIRDWRWLWLRRKTIEVPTVSVRVP